ncbi:MAG: S-adenosyl-l-methionine hydroxide adenosyltransferase family protein [Candidatus Methylomirabilales bacterium]
MVRGASAGHRHPIITLLTDFGTADPFVGIMKGVILGINPRVEVVDLCHGVSPQDVLEAAFLLHCSYRYFPKGTIHLVVVDPGVGGGRRPLLAEGVHGYYVAPDNGVLSYLFASGEIRRVLEITVEEYFLHPVSQTFHARDIFASVAAHLSQIGNVDHFGKRLTEYVRLALPTPEREGEGLLLGSILHMDRFGNLITNISTPEILSLHPERGITVRIKGRRIHGLVTSYDCVRLGEMGAILGSAGYLEIFANRGSAASILKVGRGATVRVEGKVRARGKRSRRNSEDVL